MIFDSSMQITNRSIIIINQSVVLLKDNDFLESTALKGSRG